MLQDFENQRKSQRLDCLVPVEGRLGKSVGGCKTIDFSRGGIGFISRSELPLNEEITMEIDLAPDAEPVLVVGKVKWVDELHPSGNYRIGVSFDRFTEGSQEPLEAYFKDS
jgi:c-di-GMP-binding flagellar brake protein YcgR